MAIQDILFAEGDRRFLDDGTGPIGPGQSTLESMLSGLNLGEVGRSVSPGLPQQEQGLVPGDTGIGMGTEPGPTSSEFNWMDMGKALGLSEDRINELMGIRAGWQARPADLGFQGEGGQRVRGLAREGFSTKDIAGGALMQDPTSRDFSGQATDRGMVNLPTAQQYQTAAVKDLSSAEANRNYLNRVGKAGSPDVLFHNLRQLPQEMIGKIDFSNENVLMNLSNPTMLQAMGGKDRKSFSDEELLDKIYQKPDKDNMLTKVIKTGVPAIVKGLISYINPIAGAAASTLMDTARGASLTDALKGAGIGLASSIAGGAVSGGIDAAQAGTSLAEGALGGVTDTLTSAGLSGAGDTLLGTTPTQPTIEELGGPYASPEAALEAGAGGKFALEDLVTGSGEWAIPGVTNAGANLSAQFEKAPTGKDLLRSVAGDTISAFSSIFSPQAGGGIESTKGSGLYATGTGLVPGYMGAGDVGAGAFNTFSEQQVGGIGAR